MDLLLAKLNSPLLNKQTVYITRLCCSTVRATARRKSTHGRADGRRAHGLGSPAEPERRAQAVSRSLARSRLSPRSLLSLSGVSFNQNGHCHNPKSIPGLSDYAAKTWGGLAREYHAPRQGMFVKRAVAYLNSPSKAYLVFKKVAAAAAAAAAVHLSCYQVWGVN